MKMYVRHTVLKSDLLRGDAAPAGPPVLLPWYPTVLSTVVLKVNALTRL